MDRETFAAELIKSNLRSIKVLTAKQDEYSDPDGNRLQQFYDAAEDEGITPIDALIGMARKDWISLSHFSRTAHPEANPIGLKMWHEKTVDLRNYTILLEALLVDMGVE